MNLTVNNIEFEVETAETPQEQKTGLGNRSNLPPKNGMLFRFNNDDYRTFWMDGMQFPIDMIWIDFKGEVVGVTESAQPPKPQAPESEPENLPVYRSPLPCRYVLELNAGEAKEHNISKGKIIDGIPSDITIIQIRKSSELEDEVEGNVAAIDKLLAFTKQMAGSSQLYEEIPEMQKPKKTAAEEQDSPELHSFEAKVADMVAIKPPQDDLDVIGREQEPPASHATNVPGAMFIKQEGGGDGGGTVATSSDSGFFTPTFGGKHPKHKKDHYKVLSKTEEFVLFMKENRFSDFLEFTKQARQGLVKKEVDVHLADGTTYKSHRWVRSEDSRIANVKLIVESGLEYNASQSVEILSEHLDEYEDKEIKALIDKHIYNLSTLSAINVFLPFRFVEYAQDSLKKFFEEKYEGFKLGEEGYDFYRASELPRVAQDLYGAFFRFEQRKRLNESLGITDEVREHFAKEHLLPDELTEIMKSHLGKLSDLKEEDPATQSVKMIDELYRETGLGSLHLKAKKEWEQSSSNPFSYMLKESISKRDGVPIVFNEKNTSDYGWGEKLRKAREDYSGVFDDYVNMHQKLSRQMLDIVFPNQDEFEISRGTSLKEIGKVSGIAEGVDVEMVQNPVSSWSLLDKAPNSFAYEESMSGKGLSSEDGRAMDHEMNEERDKFEKKWKEEYRDKNGDFEYNLADYTSKFQRDWLKHSQDWEKQWKLDRGYGAVVLSTKISKDEIWAWYGTHSYNGNEREILMLSKPENKIGKISKLYEEFIE